MLRGHPADGADSDTDKCQLEYLIEKERKEREEEL